MTKLQLISSQRSQQFAELSRFFFDHGISPQLSLKVRRNAQFALDRLNHNTPEAKIELLRYVSEPLLRELHFEIRGPVLLNHPLFSCYVEVNPEGIRKMCHLALSHLMFSQADDVFVRRESPAEPRMFFVVNGRLSYWLGEKGEGESLASPVRPGHWMAEAALWTSWIHLGTLQAQSESELLALKADTVQHIASKFPSHHIHTYAHEFMKILQHRPPEDLTDAHRSEDTYWLIGLSFPDIRPHIARNIENAEPPWVHDHSVLRTESERMSGRRSRDSDHKNFAQGKSRWGSMRQTLHKLVPR